jgi:hypothetical protein
VDPKVTRGAGLVLGVGEVRQGAAGGCMRCMPGRGGEAGQARPAQAGGCKRPHLAALRCAPA